MQLSVLAALGPVIVLPTSPITVTFQTCLGKPGDVDSGYVLRVSTLPVKCRRNHTMNQLFH